MYYKLFLVLLVLFSTSVNSKQVDISTNGRVDIESVELIESNYFGARLLVSFSAFDNLFPVNICVEVSWFADSCYPGEEGFGQEDNTREISLIRSFGALEGGVSKEVALNIDITTKHGLRKQIKKIVPLLIEWPSKLAAEEKYFKPQAEEYDFKEIDSIELPIMFPEFEEIVTNLVSSGLPLEKIRATRSYTLVPLNTVAFGEKTDPIVLRKVLQLISKTTDTELAIAMKATTPNSPTKQVISVGSMYSDSSQVILVDAELKSKILSENTDSAEFYSQIGLVLQDSSYPVKKRIEEAYRLIDAGRNQGSGAYETAKGILEEVLDNDANQPQAYLELARIEMRTNWPEGLSKAENLILTARDINPEHANTRVLLGYVYTNFERFDEAEAEYLLAEKLGTDNLWLYANWGLNEEKQGNVEAAIAQYLKVANKERPAGRNIQPWRWVFGYSKFTDMLKETKEYETLDNLYGRFAKNRGKHYCAGVEHARIKLELLDDPQEAIKTYLEDKGSICRDSGAVLSLAYYQVWRLAKAKANGSENRSVVLRKANALAPADDVLFFELAKMPRLTGLMDALYLERDINFINSKGETALIRAIEKNHKAAVKTLLENKADPNVSKDQFVTPLLRAIQNNNLDIVTLLVDFGADLEVLKMYGITPENFKKEI